MKKEMKLLALLVVGSVLAFRSGGNAGETAEEQALAAAETWLTLVDKGDYGKSWRAAAEYFKAAITQDEWNTRLGAARSPLGKVVSRKLKSSKYATSLPGSPNGEYVVIQFETAFAKKKRAIETITPMRDEDNHWRVAGYYIK